MNKLKVAHWKCFKLTQSRHFEFENFLNIFKPDIISIQNEEEARLLLRFDCNERKKGNIDNIKNFVFIQIQIN